MASHEIVVRGGTVVDGNGTPGVGADIGIDDGKITAVGGSLTGDHVIDADGAIVAPGWVDVHTTTTDRPPGTTLWIPRSPTASPLL